MKISFLGAARTVTGSCYLLEYKDKRFLVDCGLFQGSKELKERNYGDFKFNPADIDFMVLTHAHIDHAGLIPKLYTHGFKGPVYTTKGTVELSSVLLPDCGYIQEMEVERKNRKNERAGGQLLKPIYTPEDAQACMKLFKGYDYDEVFEPIENVKMILKEAGHILGSAMLEIFYDDEEGKQRHLIFTGDMGRPQDFIVNEPTVFEQADFIVMESTYGNRHHEEIDDSAEKMAEVIKRTLKRGGNVVIPAFAIDRTQDLLILLNGMMEDGTIPNTNIFLDSPLAVAATEIFARNPQYFNEELLSKYVAQGGSPFKFPHLIISRTVADSVAINQIKGGAIIISASGMADAGRIRHHLKHNLWRQESTVIFIGYQAEGTLGRRLLEGEKVVRIHGEEIQVRAEIVRFDGFSAHADQDELLAWLANFKKAPANIFLTHGEEEGMSVLAAEIKKQLGFEAVMPLIGDVFELHATEATAETPAVKPKLVVEGSKLAKTIDESVIPEIYYALRIMTEKGEYAKIKQLQEYIKQLNAQ